MNIFKDLLTNVGMRIDKPEFVKDFKDSSAILAGLEDMAQAISDVAVKDEMAMDMVFIKAGDQGEKMYTSN